MSSKAMSLKGKIKKLCKIKKYSAQVVLQNYMFERFLARLSMSDYREKFVVKGWNAYCSNSRIGYQIHYGP